MSVADILSQPWAILPAKHGQLIEVYDRHLQGIRLSDEGIKAVLQPDGQALDTNPGYTVENGIAIIQVQGVMAKKMNLFTAISGGTSMQMMTENVQNAINDPSVQAIMLDMDTPGGEVDGTQQLADAVKNSTKPTVAFVDGMACSAGLWVASQCDHIYAASDTTAVGSLGVIVQLAEYSKANESRGKTVTHIVTGKYKGAGGSDKPLSRDDQDYFQARVDFLKTLFLNAVANGRDMDPQVLDDMAGDAQVFFAQQAVDNGLIDGIASRDEVLAHLAQTYSQTNS